MDQKFREKVNKKSNGVRCIGSKPCNPIAAFLLHATFNTRPGSFGLVPSMDAMVGAHGTARPRGVAQRLGGGRLFRSRGRGGERTHTSRADRANIFIPSKIDTEGKELPS